MTNGRTSLRWFCRKHWEYGVKAHLTPRATRAASMAPKLSVAPYGQADPSSVPSRRIWLASAGLGLLQHP